MRTTVKLRAKLQRSIGSVLLLVATMAHADPPPPRVEKDDPKVRFQHGVDLFATAITAPRSSNSGGPTSCRPTLAFFTTWARRASKRRTTPPLSRPYVATWTKSAKTCPRAAHAGRSRSSQARCPHRQDHDPEQRRRRRDLDRRCSGGPHPLSAPLVVGAGRRRIVLSALRVQQSRIVDLAGGDNTTIDLPISSGATQRQGRDSADASRRRTARIRTTAPRARGAPVVFSPATRPSPGLSTAQTAGIVTTGVLAAGAGVMGALALVAKGEFDGKLENRPSTKAEIDSVRTRTRNLALTTDIVGGVAFPIVGSASALISDRARPAASEAAAKRGGQDRSFRETDRVRARRVRFRGSPRPSSAATQTRPAWRIALT